MPSDDPVDWNDALWKKQHEIADQLYYTNKLLRKLSRRSIFWPVCFAIILAPIVGFMLWAALFLAFTTATLGGAAKAARLNAEQRLLEMQQEAIDAVPHSPSGTIEDVLGGSDR